MQVYKAPINDYKFLIKDFLNSNISESILQKSDLNIEDINMILEEAAKMCEDTLLPINQSGDIEGCNYNNGEVISLISN